MKRAEKKAAVSRFEVFVAPFVEELVFAVRVRSQLFDELVRHEEPDDVQVDAHAELHELAAKLRMLVEESLRFFGVLLGESREKKPFLGRHVSLELGLESRPQNRKLLSNAMLEGVEHLLEQIFEPPMIGKEMIVNARRRRQ